MIKIDNTQLAKNIFYRYIDKSVPGGFIKDVKNEGPERKIYFQKISMEGLEDMYQYSKGPLIYNQTN